MNDGLKPETQLIQDGPFRDERYGAVIPPLYQNSTFTFDSWDALQTYAANEEHQALGGQLVANAVGGIDGILVLDLEV